MESRFTALFNTNYVPSDEEIQHIRMDLVSRAQDLARIDERIHELSAQKERIQRYIESHEALISYPVVSPQILCEKYSLHAFLRTGTPR